MTFEALLCGCLVFAIGFAAHVCWWRLARPADDFRALGLCLLLLPVLLAAAFPLVWPQLLSLREAVAAGLAAIAIGAIYIMYYPAAQAASPTMLLVLQIGRSAPLGGVSRASLRETFDNEILCRQSVANLVHEHFAGERDGKLFLAARGLFLLRMLNTWRSYLGLKYGSG
jgi:hypothetical protein